MDSEEGECGEEIRHWADVDSNEEAGINVDTRDLELCFDFFELFFYYSIRSHLFTRRVPSLF